MPKLQLSEDDMKLLESARRRKEKNTQLQREYAARQRAAGKQRFVTWVDKKTHQEALADGLMPFVIYIKK